MRGRAAPPATLRRVSDAPPPRPGMPTWAKVLLGIAAVSCLCCGGVVVVAWGTIREAFEFAGKSPAEQQAAVQSMLRAMVAEQVAVTDVFLADLDAGRTSEAWARTSPTFRSAMDEEGLEKLRRKVAAVMGARQSAVLQNAFTRNTSTLGGPAVETCDITYAATYANGPATLTFTVERGAAGWTVRLFRIDSPRFLEALPETAPDESPK